MLQSFVAKGVAGFSHAIYEYDAIGRSVAKNVGLGGDGRRSKVFVQAGQQVTCDYTPGNATSRLLSCVSCSGIADDGTYYGGVAQRRTAQRRAERPLVRKMNVLRFALRCSLSSTFLTIVYGEWHFFPPRRIS